MKLNRSALWLVLSLGGYGFHPPTAFSAVRAEWAPESLRRETTMPLKECSRSEFAPNLPSATRYIERIFARITGHPANRLTFLGDLAPQRICVGVSLGGERAWANSESRTVTVESGIILRAQNDAQVAAMLAHELGHITMRHAYLDGTIVPSPDREVWQQAFRERLTVLHLIEEVKTTEPSPFSAAGTLRMNGLQQRDGELNEIMNGLVTRHFGAEVAANWIEAEADSVGLHFYLASGFTTDEIAWRSQQVAISEAAGVDVHGPPLPITAANRRQLAYAACNVSDPASMPAPRRGTQRYPESCWSIWDLLHEQFRLHPQYAVQVREGEQIVHMPGDPSLAQAKAEILMTPVPEQK